MAIEQKVTYWHNDTEHCTIGAKPEEETGWRKDGSYVVQQSPGNKPLFLAPGDQVIDAGGRIALAVQNGHEVFIRCASAAEMDKLGVPEAARVYAHQKHPRERCGHVDSQVRSRCLKCFDPGAPDAPRCVGFYGLNLVLKDVTSSRQHLVEATGNRITSMQRLAELEAAEKDAQAKASEASKTLSIRDKQLIEREAEIEALKRLLAESSKAAVDAGKSAVAATKKG